jgi:hypothetical protein
MRKLTIAAVVLAIVVAAVVSVIPALCVNGGAHGNTCDLVSVLRGGVRIVNSDRCQQTPQPVDCSLLATAGLTRK